MRKKKAVKPHYSKDMTDDQLLAFWMVTFGNRPVASWEMSAIVKDDKDFWPTANEMAARGLVEIFIDKVSGARVYSTTRSLEHADS